MLTHPKLLREGAAARSTPRHGTVRWTVPRGGIEGVETALEFLNELECQSFGRS